MRRNSSTWRKLQRRQMIHSFFSAPQVISEADSIWQLKASQKNTRYFRSLTTVKTSHFLCVLIPLCHFSPQRGAMYSGPRGHRLVRQSSVPVAGGSAPPPIQAGQKTEAATKLVGVLNRTQSSAKEMLLIWVQQRVNDYPVTTKDDSFPSTLTNEHSRSRFRM